jgi:hypothetical protein
MPAPHPGPDFFHVELCQGGYQPEIVRWFGAKTHEMWEFHEWIGAPPGEQSHPSDLS